MKIFWGETCSDVSSVRLFSVRKKNFLVLRMMATSNTFFLRVIAVINNFLNLMFDLFLADRPVGIRGVLRLRFLFAIKGFKQFFVGRFLFFLQR